MISHSLLGQIIQNSHLAGAWEVSLQAFHISGASLSLEEFLYTAGSLSLTVRLLTTSRREKNIIKTHSAEANDNWKKPTLRMGKEKPFEMWAMCGKVSSLGA